MEKWTEKNYRNRHNRRTNVRRLELKSERRQWCSTHTTHILTAERKKDIYFYLTVCSINENQNTPYDALNTHTQYNQYNVMKLLVFDFFFFFFFRFSFFSPHFSLVCRIFVMPARPTIQWTWKKTSQYRHRQSPQPCWHRASRCAIDLSLLLLLYSRSKHETWLCGNVCGDQIEFGETIYGSIQNRINIQFSLLYGERMRERKLLLVSIPKRNFKNSIRYDEFGARRKTPIYRSQH